MDTIRVLIADDHQLFRDGVRALISSAPDMELVGEAATGDEVIALALELPPDVVLMDIQMPGVNGIEATRQIARANPTVGILMLTMFHDDPSVFSAMRAGARGYILKGAKHAEMLRAIRAVASGEAIFSPRLAARMIEFFSSMTAAASPQVFPDLTEREREILGLIAQGLRNTEIAERLVISEKTVRNYITSIFSKLQVADRAHAIIRAREAGLGHSS